MFAQSYNVAQHGGIIRPAKKIDLSNTKKLYARIKTTSNYTNSYLRIAVKSDLGTYYQAYVLAEKSTGVYGAHTLELDVSKISGAQYVMFAGIYTQKLNERVSFYTYEVWSE
jgi:hypothetical protein